MAKQRDANKAAAVEQARREAEQLAQQSRAAIETARRDVDRKATEKINYAYQAFA